MQVNGEIDALRTMGFGPMRYLVLPRTLALTLVLPLLTLLADVAGVVGGLVVGVWNLELTARGYLYRDGAGGHALGHLVGRHQERGLRDGHLADRLPARALARRRRGGRRAPHHPAVVLTLFALILTDAVATVIFRMAGL